MHACLPSSTVHRQVLRLRLLLRLYDYNDYYYDYYYYHYYCYCYLRKIVRAEHDAVGALDRLHELAVCVVDFEVFGTLFRRPEAVDFGPVEELVNVRGVFGRVFPQRRMVELDRIRLVIARREPRFHYEGGELFPFLQYRVREGWVRRGG